MIDVIIWKDRYSRNIVTKEMVDTLYSKGKITLSEYLEILNIDVNDGNILPMLPEQEKEEVDLIKQLEAYKHTYVEFVEYKGHQQRFLESDRLEMLDAQEALEREIQTEIQWKYPDEYVIVTDPQYFIDMRLTGGTAKQKAFKVEYILVEEINLLTEEELKTYDLKQRFDEVFKSL